MNIFVANALACPQNTIRKLWIRRSHQFSILTRAVALDAFCDRGSLAVSRVR